MPETFSQRPTAIDCGSRKTRVNFVQVEKEIKRASTPEGKPAEALASTNRANWSRLGVFFGSEVFVVNRAFAEFFMGRTLLNDRRFRICIRTVKLPGFKEF